MTREVQAVILAAGRGARLAERTRDLPKALLPIGPRALHDPTPTCFLRRQVELLHECGVRDVVVVLGCLKEQILSEARSWQLPLRFVVNPTANLDTSGSLHSFQFAVRSPYGVLSGERDTLLMDADIVYHRAALPRLLAADGSALLVSATPDGDDEEVRVFGTPEQPRFVGKGLTRELAGGEACLGEAVGIVKFAAQDCALARTTLDWLLGDPDAPAGSARRRGFGPARQATEHEELTQRFMHYGKLSCVLLGADAPFMEVDDVRDYELLRAQFYPRLLELEAGGAAP